MHGKVFRVSILILLILVTAGCSPEQNSSESKTVRILYADWAGTMSLTFLTKVILEERLGYKVILTKDNASNIYASLSRGEYDFFMGAWLPETHQRYLQHYSDKIVVAGPNYRGAQTGLAVPDYVPVNCITELDEHKDLFNNTIYGIEKSAGIMNNTVEAKRVYGLGFNLDYSNEKTMTALIDSAVHHREWILVTGWRPHWMFEKFNLKFLSDPENVFGSTETINTVTRKDFRQTNPYLYRVLKKINLNQMQMESLIKDIRYIPADPEKAAKSWMEKNLDLVESWIPKED